MLWMKKKNGPPVKKIQSDRLVVRMATLGKHLKACLRCYTGWKLWIPERPVKDSQPWVRMTTLGKHLKACLRCYAGSKLWPPSFFSPLSNVSGATSISPSLSYISSLLSLSLSLSLSTPNPDCEWQHYYTGWKLWLPDDDLWKIPNHECESRACHQYCLLSGGWGVKIRKDFRQFFAK